MGRIFSALHHHPDVPDALPPVTAWLLLEGLKLASTLVAFSTFGLLFFANSAFIHARMKEFGLLSSPAPPLR
ncbi:MAG: hypothetical protein DIU70_007500 [Bacillota bacterium]